MALPVYFSLKPQIDSETSDYTGCQRPSWWQPEITISCTIWSYLFQNCIFVYFYFLRLITNQKILPFSLLIFSGSPLTSIFA